MAYEFQLKSLLLIGHIGKLVKLGAGIMNTHSRMGRCQDGSVKFLFFVSWRKCRAGTGNSKLYYNGRKPLIEWEQYQKREADNGTIDEKNRISFKTTSV